MVYFFSVFFFVKFHPARGSLQSMKFTLEFVLLCVLIYCAGYRSMSLPKLGLKRLSSNILQRKLFPSPTQLVQPLVFTIREQQEDNGIEKFAIHFLSKALLSIIPDETNIAGKEKATYRDFVNLTKVIIYAVHP